MSEIALRHRDASGSLSAGCWEYDPARRAVVVVLRAHDVGEIVAVDVPVCSRQTARHGSFSLRRLDGDVWRIMPAQYLAGPGGELTVMPVACVDALGVIPILLTHAPPSVSDEMVRA